MRKRLGRLGALALVVSLGLTATAAGHDFDHPAPAFAPTAPPSPAFVASPAGKWELVATIPTGNPHTDLDFFTQGDEIYASVGTLAIGPNAGGQTIVQLTENGEVTATSPRFVSAHPSAACGSEPSNALGLQHDVEATPKGDVIFNTSFPSGVQPVRTDAKLLLDATDASGRCHDAATAGAPGSAQGGIEIVDITDVENPVEIALTSHIGEAHTVNVDPKRPHIAFVVTSDTVSASCNADDSSCSRANGLNLDGFELLDLSSCLTDDSPLVKRQTCEPEVYRYRFPSALIALGHTVDALAGCHEVEIYPDDRLTCASINASVVFDLSGAFDDRGTPTDFTDDKPRGTPLPCALRSSSSPGPFATGAKVIDCVDRDSATPGNDLDLASYTAPSLEGVVHVGTVFHQGRGGPNQAPADVDVSHEAELSGSGRLLLVTDERGGGVTPPGASCVPSAAGDNPDGNGGIHAYRMDRLLKTSPNDPAVAWSSYAEKPGGGKAIYRAPVNTGPQASLCTSHVFHQIPGQNRIFMGWYSQGTQVVDFVEHPNGTVEFKQAGYFIPANANTWVSAVFKMKENADGSFTYWGATGDFFLGAAGRSAIDVWKVTLPAPPKPFGQGGGTGPQGDSATGGGWLARSDGKKINFGFAVKRAGSGFAGELELNDKAAGAKIHVKQITALGPVAMGCGSVPESPRSLELRGTGTYNGQSATFRACVQDNGEPGTGADLFYLSCSCGYETGGPTPDDTIDGGNVQVRRSTATSSGGSAPSTLILDPVLLTTGTVGQTQLLGVRAFDASQNPLPGATVTLTRTTAGGGTEVVSAVTGPLGVASIPVVVGLQPVEYIASVGGLQSNAVSIAP